MRSGSGSGVQAQIANKVIRGLNNSLIKGGWLFLSPTDAIRPLPEELVPVRCPGTTTYRKEAGRISQHEEYHGFTQESITPQEINVPGILSSHNPEDVIEGSDGITAGRLAEVIDSFDAT